MKELENNLLEKLPSSEGSLVDDEDIIDVLQGTKETSAEVSKKLETSTDTENKINAAHEEFSQGNWWGQTRGKKQLCTS